MNGEHVRGGGEGNSY